MYKKTSFSTLLKIFCLFAFLVVGLNGCRDDDSGCGGTWQYTGEKMRPARKLSEHVEDLSNQTFENDIGTQLPYDLMQPGKLADPEEPKLVVLLHEGAFVVGNKDNYIIEKIGRRFAEKGYTVAMLNYSKLQDMPSALAYHKRLIATAVEDVRNAIITIQSRTGFRPENTYVVGYSAGAIIANHLVFSQQDEMEAYVNDSEWCRTNPSSSVRPFDAAISISGGLMNLSHIDYGDLEDHALLMIHGVNDNMIPYGSGAIAKRYTDRETRVDISIIEIDIGTFGPIGQQLVVPAWAKKLVRDILAGGRICGPGCIQEEVGEHPNFCLIGVEDGGHNLVVNAEDGHLTVTCGKIIREVDQLIMRRKAQRQSAPRRTKRERK